MARTDQQFPLRLPPELKEKLENACKESGRSKNAEAVYRLEQSFSNTNNNEVSDLKKEMERMNETIKILSTTLSSLVERIKK